MQFEYNLFLFLVFTSVSILIYIIFLSISKRYVKSRLFSVIDTQNTANRETAVLLSNRWNRLWNRLSKMTVPTDVWSDEYFHAKLLRAGFRNNNVVLIYFTLRALFTVAFPVTLFMVLTIKEYEGSVSLWSLLLLSAAILGYLLPALYIHLRTNSRIALIQQGVPDLIDLLVICTEAGLGIDSALSRVSHEMLRSNPELAEELFLTNLEIRAGAGRSKALSNLAARTNVDSLKDLVSILTQSEHFGTSISDSLRTQAGIIRKLRMQAAEEIASKIPVKMLLPMVFFIFPSLIIVVIGPAFIQIAAVFKL